MKSHVFVRLDELLNKLRLQCLSVRRLDDSLENVLEQTRGPNITIRTGDMCHLFTDKPHAQSQGRDLLSLANLSDTPAAQNTQT